MSAVHASTHEGDDTTGGTTPRKSPKVSRNIKIERELWDEVAATAAKDPELDMSKLVRRAIREYLDRVTLP